jgi:cytochrome b561
MALATLIVAADASREARLEGWLWWVTLVIGLLVLLLVLATLRRRLLRPMPHKPSDTSDAWAEAGRRLAAPPAEDGGATDPDDKASP